MINESCYWKAELVRLSKRLKKRILDKGLWTDAKNGAFEMEIMFGFYIIRKLIESQKLPNRLVATKVEGMRFPNKDVVVHLLNVHRYNEHYDFKKGKEDKFDLQFLINQIVHSYVFSPEFDIDENNGETTLSVIHFCSDKSRNEWLYELKLSTIISLFDKIASGFLEKTVRMTFDESKKDYRIFEGDDKISSSKDKS